MSNPTYYLACLEKLENERKARALLSVVNSQLAIIAKFKRSKAWRETGKLLRQSRAL
jgi:hypothetical protein